MQRRGYRHQVTIDGQIVWLDSQTEEIALRRLLDKYGFTGKWLRPEIGIKHSGKYYTPDFELAINYYGNTSRALVEIKQYRRDFTKDMAARMSAVARHYHTDCLLLYAVKTDKWYRIVPRSGSVRETTPPQSGKLNLDDLIQPRRFVTKNFYGRRYNQSFINAFLLGLGNILFPSKPKRRRRY